MQYSLERIDTVAGCDALLVLAQKQKSDLERKRRNLGEAIEKLRQRIACIGKDADQVQSLLKAYTAAHDSLPDGKVKACMNVDVKRLELRQARLDKKAFTSNARTLLAREVQFNRLASQALAVESFIGAVQGRRETLAQAVLRVSRVVVRLHPPVAPQKRQPGIRQKQAHFVRPAVVHQKHRPEKSLYRLSVHFSGASDGTCKTASLERHAQFSSA